MNTWKRFSDEMPPEGACIETTAKDGLNAQLHREWKINFTTGHMFWWRIWEGPPKPVSAREEAFRFWWEENPNRIVFGHDEVWTAGWTAACKHIERRIRELRFDSSETGTMRDCAARIAREAAE